MTLTWLASSLVSHKPLELSGEPLMVRDPVRYGWMMWHAQEANHISTTAVTVDGETVIALIAETSVWSALIVAILSFAW